MARKKKKRHGTSLPLPAQPKGQQAQMDNIPIHPPNMHKVMRSKGTIRG